MVNESRKGLRERLIADCDNLNALLLSDDITDEALREASEELLPHIASSLRLVSAALAEARPA